MQKKKQLEVITELYREVLSIAPVKLARQSAVQWLPDRLVTIWEQIHELYIQIKVFSTY